MKNITTLFLFAYYGICIYFIPVIDSRPALQAFAIYVFLLLLGLHLARMINRKIIANDARRRSEAAAEKLRNGDQE